MLRYRADGDGRARFTPGLPRGTLLISRPRLQAPIPVAQISSIWLRPCRSSCDVDETGVRLVSGVSA